MSLAEGKQAGLSMIETNSLCVDEITNRLVSLIAPAIGASQISIDVGGAYFHGTPPSVAEGGAHGVCCGPTVACRLRSLP